MNQAGDAKCKQQPVFVEKIQRGEAEALTEIDASGSRESQRVDGNGERRRDRGPRQKALRMGMVDRRIFVLPLVTLPICAVRQQHAKPTGSHRQPWICYPKGFWKQRGFQSAVTAGRARPRARLPEPPQSSGLGS